MTSTSLFVPRPEVVALIADCLRHPETELLLQQIPEWKHEDGRPVTEEEIEVLHGARLGEISVAVDVDLARSAALDLCISVAHREADERVAHLTTGECDAALKTREAVTAMCASLGLPPHGKDCKALTPLEPGLVAGDVCIHAYTANALAKRSMEGK